MRLILAVVLWMLLSGCATVSYYGQAVKGHLQITTGKRDIQRLLADPDTDPELARRLRTVRSIREFAITELLLPDSGSYTDFVDLKRDVTLWLVSATPAYSLTPRQWCYLVVGCFSYRGYFKREAADQAVDKLRAQGLDVVLVPGLAYSTLGFANDPVLNTMLRYSDFRLAGVLFHELAHERLYVRSDSRFNESFATAVETIGQQRWAEAHQLAAQPFVDPRTNPRQQAVDTLVLDTRSALETLYASTTDEAQLAAGKSAIFDEFAQGHERLQSHWHGASPIAHWFRGDGPNNARLALYSTYELEVPGFLQLYTNCEQDLACFYDHAQTLASLGQGERSRRLRALGQLAAPGLGESAPDADEAAAAGEDSTGHGGSASAPDNSRR